MLRVIRTSSLLRYSMGLVVLCVALLFLWPGLRRNLFAYDGFMTHEHWYLGIGPLVALHYYSDWLIGLSYVSISLTLTYLVYRARRDIPFHWVFLAFGLFIIACGGTHFMEAWTTFRAPVYWLAGYVKLITVVASVSTALVLPPLVPKMLALVRAAKTSEQHRAQLEAAYAELQARVDKLSRTETASAAAQHELSELVRELDLRRAEAATTAAAQRATNQTLEAIIQASPLAIVVLDPDGIVKLWNSAAERIYGWSEQEVLNRLLPTVPTGQEEELRRNQLAAVSGHNFSNYETKRQRKDGRLIDVSISTAPLKDDTGRTTGVMALVDDITERKRAEAALRQSEERNLALLDAIPDLMFRFSRAGLFLDVHATQPDDLLLPPTEFIGRHVAEVMPAEIADETLRYIERAAASRELQVYEYELTRAGTTYSYEARVVASGEDEVIFIVRDITKRKHRETAQRFLADATIALAASLDYEQTLERVARLAVPEMADCCLVDMLDEETGAILRVVVAHRDPTQEEPWREMQRRWPLDPKADYTIPRVLRTGQPEIYPELTEEMARTVLRDEEHIKALLSFGIKASMIVPLKARGRTLGALSFISTTAARKYDPHELALAEELARRAALAIDNARLYQRAQEANRTKDEFLATLSHELRTPLTPIIGWVRMMTNGQLGDADLARGLAVIDNNAQALARLINDLLDMSAIINGKMRIDHLPVTLDHVLREAVETVRPLAETRRIEIELSVCAGDDGEGGLPLFVSGDRTRLGQVFWNLITNAIKFSHDGGRVRVRCLSDAGEARVEVEDEGTGIAPEFMPHIFDRFRQADMSTTKRHSGLGIGLALVKSFIEAHGGTVKAESAGAERGSRFTVRLPRMQLAAPPAPTLPPAQPTSAQTERKAAPRILLVEDADDTLELLRVAFARRGYRVTACATAHAALDVAAREHFDIIIFDIGLPQIDGYELLARLRREQPRLRHVPAVALTGYAAAQDIERARAEGFAAHVAKPIDPITLARVVEQLLAQ